jgi:hypothetical protein
MNKFGILKEKILHKLTEAYVNGNKSEIKNILKLVKENKEFRELYLFYDEIEDKYIENPLDAELYLEEILPLLRDKMKEVAPVCVLIDKKIGEVTINENELYSDLDTFIESRKLQNVDKKITAKKRLVEHLTTKKDLVETVSTTTIENESLLNNVLANNFNVLYGSTLSEDEKKQLTEILSIPESDLKSNFNVLQEEVITKINKLLAEEKNTDLTQKLNTALIEAEHMKSTKYNYYKLQQLKNGL